VLNWSRDRWVQQQDDLARRSPADWLVDWSNQRVIPPPESWSAESAIDDLVGQTVTELAQRRQLAPATLPASADDLAGLVENLLRQCGSGQRTGVVYHVKRPKGKYNRRPAFDLLVQQTDPDGTQHTTGLAFVITASANSATASLKRLVQDGATADRIVLITDVRQPLNLGGAGKDYLEQLRRRPSPPVLQVELRFDEYAALDALQHAVGLARASELELRLPTDARRPVLPQEVIDSHHRQDRYRAHRLLGLLLDPAAGRAPANAAVGRQASPGFFTRQLKPEAQAKDSVGETFACASGFNFAHCAGPSVVGE
jgi:hypothetical protein